MRKPVAGFSFSDSTGAVAGQRPQIGNRLASSALLLWATAMLSRVLQLATVAILAHILGPADYGLVATAMVAVGVLEALSNFEVSSAIIKTRDLTAAHLDTAFTLNLIRGVLSAVALAAMARPVSVYMHEPRLANILYVLAVPALLSGLHNPYFLLFARDLDFWMDSRRDAVATALGSAAGIVVAFVLRSYWALVIASVTTSFAATVFSYWRVKATPRLNLRKAGEILRYGGWLALINGLNFLNWRVDYVLIGHGLGAKVLGAYNVGQTLTNSATGDVVSSLGRALFPAFSMLAHDVERLRRGYRQIQTMTLMIALPIGFGMSAVASDAVLLLFGSKWALAIPVVTLLAPIAALQTMVASIESLALSSDKGMLLFVRSLVFFLFRVMLMFVGFYLGGYLGIIYARVITGIFFLFYGLGLAAAITKGHWHDPITSGWRSFAAVAAMYMAFACLPLSAIWQLAVPALALLLATKIIIGAAIYIGVHSLLWRACRMPDGAERQLVQQGQRFLSSLKLRSNRVSFKEMR